MEKYGDRGFNLIAFPCNQFGQQAPGTSQEEREFAIRKFGFEFDVFVSFLFCLFGFYVFQDKIEVNGLGAHPLYKYLKRQQPASSPKGGYSRRTNEIGAIEWNYTKFLINRQGKPVRRYSPSYDPLGFEGDVSQATSFHQIQTNAF